MGPGFSLARIRTYLFWYPPCCRYLYVFVWVSYMVVGHFVINSHSDYITRTLCAVRKLRELLLLNEIGYTGAVKSVQITVLSQAKSTGLLQLGANASKGSLRRRCFSLLDFSGDKPTGTSSHRSLTRCNTRVSPILLVHCILPWSIWVCGIASSINA